MLAMLVAATVVTSPLPGCTGLLSVSCFPIGVVIKGAVQDPGRRADLRLRRLQDRIPGTSGPGRERLAEIAVGGVFGGNHQALPAGEPSGECLAADGQVVDPLARPGGVPSRGW